MSKIPNLNRLIKGEMVTSSLGIAGSIHPGRPLKCPSCSKSTLYIHPDPMGGDRFHCLHCRINVSSIQLYAISRKIALPKAIKEIQKKCSVSLGSAETWALDWIKDIVEPEQKLIKLLEEGKKRFLVERDLQVDSLLYTHKCVHSSDAESLRRCFGGGVAVVERKELEKISAKWGLAKSIPKHTSKFMAIPFCDVGNRPRYIRLLRKNKEHVIVVPLEDMETDTLAAAKKLVPGLGFLDQLHGKPDTVIAVRGVETGLCLSSRIRYMSQRYAVVLWDELTDPKVWKMAGINKVIFWDHQMDALLFSQASAVKDSHIVVDDIGSEKACDWLSGRWPTALTEHLKKKCRPWREVFLRWLREEDPDSILESLSDVVLDKHEVGRILDECQDEEEKYRVAKLLGQVLGSQSVLIDETEVVQDAQGWSALTLKGKSLICDCVINLEKVQHSMNMESYVVGFVSRDEDTIPFRAPLKEIQDNTSTWLTRFMVDNSQSIPQINTKWSKKLFRIAQAFNNPRPATCLDRAGYYPDVGIVLPNFVISENGSFIKSEDLDIGDSRVPGQHLQKPKTSYVLGSSLFDMKKNNILLWAFTALITKNLCSQRSGRDTRGMAVVCGDGPDESIEAITNIAQKLYLPVYYERPEDLWDVDRGHVLPSIVDMRSARIDDPDIQRYLFSFRPKSLVLLVNDLSMWRDCSLAGWWAMNNPQNSETSPYSKHPDLIFNLFRRLVEENDFEENHSPEDLVFRAFQLLNSQIPIPTEQVYRMAKLVHENVIGDVKSTMCDFERALIPLIYSIHEMKSSNPRTMDDGNISLPSARALREFKNLTGVEYDSNDVKRMLRTVGLLKASPGNDIVIPEKDWEDVCKKYTLLKPTR